MLWLTSAACSWFLYMFCLLQHHSLPVAHQMSCSYNLQHTMGHPKLNYVNCATWPACLQLDTDVEAAAPLLWSQHSASSSGSADEPDLVAELFGADPQLRPAHTGSSHTMYGSLRNLSIRRTSSSSSLSLGDTGRRLHDSFSGYQQRRLRSKGRRLSSRHRLAANSSSLGRPSTADAAAAAFSSAALRSSLPASFSGPAAAGRMLLGGLALLGLVACAGGWLGGRGAVGDRPGRLVAAGGAAAEQQLWGVSYASWGAAMGW
jgi:hypothetical protein